MKTTRQLNAIKKKAKKQTLERIAENIYMSLRTVEKAPKNSDTAERSWGMAVHYKESGIADLNEWLRMYYHNKKHEHIKDSENR